MDLYSGQKVTEQNIRDLLNPNNEAIKNGCGCQ